MTFAAALFDATGTLTDSLGSFMVERIVAAGLDPRAVGEIMAPAVFDEGDGDSVPHRCERGEATLDELIAWAEEQLPGSGVLFDPGAEYFLFGELPWNETMLSLAADANRAGLRTAVVSNQFDGWSKTFRETFPATETFDAVVVSCEVGVRKPGPAIYRRACEMLDVDPGRTLYLDDAPAMVAGAEAVGMTGILVRDHDSAVTEARRLLEL